MALCKSNCHSCLFCSKACSIRCFSVRKCQERSRTKTCPQCQIDRKASDASRPKHLNWSSRRLFSRYNWFSTVKAIHVCHNKRRVCRNQRFEVSAPKTICVFSKKRTSNRSCLSVFEISYHTCHTKRRISRETRNAAFLMYCFDLHDTAHASCQAWTTSIMVIVVLRKLRVTRLGLRAFQSGRRFVGAALGAAGWKTVIFGVRGEACSWASVAETTAPFQACKMK